MTLRNCAGGTIQEPESEFTLYDTWPGRNDRKSFRLHSTQNDNCPFLLVAACGPFLQEAQEKFEETSEKCIAKVKD